MIKIGFRTRIVMYIMAFIFLAVALAYTLDRRLFGFAAINIVALGILAYKLFRYIDRTNRQISYFFNAVINDDFTLVFPKNDPNPSFKGLYDGLNRLNKNIYHTKLQLLSRETYYQQILRQANIGIMSYNIKGHIIYTNPSFERIVNYSPLNHINQLNRVDKQLFESVSAFEPTEHKLLQLSNERAQNQLTLKLSSIDIDNEKIYIALLQDIDRALEEKETDSWSKLIRVMTHEIMNTITPITSISESLVNMVSTHSGESKEEFSEAEISTLSKGLDVINSQGNDLMEFVQSYRSMLNVPKPDRKIFKVIDLLEKIKLVIDTNPLSHHISTSIKCTPDDLDMYADEKQLTLILQNLVKNALDAMQNQESGTINLLADTTNSGQKYIKVIDDGPGIPQHLKEQVFIPFFTTKDKGTGVGLSLSKQIMHLHGGSLSITSEVDQGTEITLML